MESQIISPEGGCSPRPRQGYWDAWKGIAIIAVIIIHACAINSLSLGGAETKLTVLVRQFVNFAVPMFLAISGLMAGLSKKPKNFDYILHRMLGLWPAYLLWTLIYILAFSRSHLLDPKSLILDVFAGAGIGIGYFVIVLSQMIVLTPLICKIRSLMMHAIIIFLFTAMGRVLTYYAVLGPYPVGSPFNGLPFFMWYPFYHLAFLIGSRVDLAVRRMKLLTISTIFIVVGLIASIIEGLELLPVDIGLASSQLKLTSTFFSLAVFLWSTLAFAILSKKTPKWLSWIGRNSYIIYLTHLIPLRAVASQNLKFRISVGQFANIFSVSLIVLLICLVGVAIGRRVLPKKLQPYFMG
ncbi:acyltransferase family protein [Novosphingobium sp. 11B]